MAISKFRITEIALIRHCGILIKIMTRKLREDNYMGKELIGVIEKWEKGERVKSHSVHT